MAKKSPASSQRRKRPAKKDSATIVMTDEMKTRLERLAQMDDKDIKLDVIPEMTNWDAAVRGKFYRPVKTPITIRLQSKTNTVLREYVRKQA